MYKGRHILGWGLIVLFCALAGVAVAQEQGDEALPPPPLEVLISVNDQKLVVLRDGGVIGKYPISTSRFGTGDSYGSYKTPLGNLKVCEKIGGDLDMGAVIKHRSATGEVIQANAPGRDPIVTRVIWLEGLEDRNKNAHARGIYIHGTPMESQLGRPVSWGCIRMRSEDVVKVYDLVSNGTPVSIIADRLPKLHKYKAPPPPPPPPPPAPLIVQSTPTPAPKQQPTPEEKKLAKVEQQAGKPEKSVAKAEAKSTPAPQLASVKKTDKKEKLPDVAEKVTFTNDEVASAPSAPVDGNAMRAMKGSILMSDMPTGIPGQLAAGSGANSKAKAQQ